MATEHTAAVEELLSIYALGGLDGEDLRLVEEHLAGGCAECAPRLAALTGDLEALAAAEPPVAPAPEILERLLREIDASTPQPEPAAAVRSLAPPAPRTRVRTPVWSWLAAAAAILLLVWGVSLRSSFSSEVESLRAEIVRLGADRDQASQRAAVLARELMSASAANERLAQAMAIISSPGMKPVALAGLKDAPSAKGHAFVDPDGKRAVFVAANLQPLPSSKTYELWYIASGKPVPAGTFAVDAKGFATVAVPSVPSVEQIQAWAVTVEPQGGVPQPTGAMVLKG